jgi:hypothetical protein
MNHASNMGRTFKAHPFDEDFAILRKGVLEIVPEEVWRELSNGGNEWATFDNTEPFW